MNEEKRLRKDALVAELHSMEKYAWHLSQELDWALAEQRKLFAKLQEIGNE